MDGIINFRPLAQGVPNRAGKHIKPNTILRSGIVSTASKNDIAALKDMDIRYIYDFRSGFEIEEMPPLPPDDFTTLHFDIVGQAAPRSYARLHGTDPEAVKSIMTGRYQTHFSRTDAYMPVIKSILAQDTDGFLFHCSAGKDRTGVFGAILMLALDFDIDAVRNEYLRIDQTQIDAMKRTFLENAGHTGDTSHLDPLFTVYPEYIDAYLQGVRQTYGSFDDYLFAVCSIDAAIKAQLQKRYLVSL